ncbi:MAG: TIM barrel protein [Armatimonadetes bacterium]|nr:TIM barrel protein [Armatimonadota bacterium]
MHIGTKLERSYRQSEDAQAAFGDEEPLAAIRELGMEFVEWPLTPEFDEEEAWALAESCWEHGLRANLHPYLRDTVDTANFEDCEGNECRGLLRRYLAFADRISEAQGHPCVVNLHPPCSRYAVSEIPTSHRRRILVLRSLFFHQWLDGLLEREGWNVTVTAEVQLAADPEEDFVRLGDHYRELLFCLGGVRRIGTCWDMGHSTINHTRYRNEMYPLEPTDEFVKRVRHVHLHDVHGREDHHPLSDGDVPYRRHLTRLRDAGFAGDINLELPLRKILQHGPYREVMADNVSRVQDAWESSSPPA